MNFKFRQIAIVGTGLIGGSFGLAVKRAGFEGRIIGCDRSAVLQRARECNAIDEGIESLAEAVQGSDLIVLATPVGAIIDLLVQLRRLPHQALITDTGSTKAAIVQRAQAVFGGTAPERFLPGHPLAGKETGGIEQADAELFQGATWIITPAKSNAPADSLETGASAFTPEQLAFIELIEKIGARAVQMDAEDHDRLCAWTSHLPQMVATALAATLNEEIGAEDVLSLLAGRALRDMTRVASSPYSMWRDIALTNKANVGRALLKLEQRLAHLRENLDTRELAEEMELGRKFRERIERGKK